jgi:CDP-diacylglycerol--serine O-phosphatidyltransferase
MKNFKYFIPNALTLINLLLGCIAIIIVFKGQNQYHAAWFILVAAVMDFLDGVVAKALDAKSEFGAQLDSLADMVSFGVAPAIIIFNWIDMVLTKLSERSTYEWISANFIQNIVLLCSLIFAAGAAIRLARFNITHRGQNYFRGLPTPAAALVIASIWLIINSETKWIYTLIWNIYFVFVVLIVLVVLMVSNLKMISLKFDGFNLKNNLYRYIILTFGIILFALFGIEGILYSMVLYLILSLATQSVKST